MSIKARSCFLIILAAALWGAVGIFVNELRAAGFSSLQIVAIRMTVPAVVYALFLAITDRKSLRIRPRDCYLFVLTGVLSFALFNWCYFNAIEASSLGVAAILLYTAPAIVTIISVWAFHERLTVKKGISVAATFVGCILVTGVGGNMQLSVKGLLFGLGAGIGYALYTVFCKIALKKYGSKTVSLYTFVFASLATIPLASFGEAEMRYFLAPNVLLLALGIGSLCCLFPYLFYSMGLANVEAGTASVMAMIEPVVAALLGVLVYHEALDGWKIAGIALIIAAVTAQSVGPRARSRC